MLRPVTLDQIKKWLKAHENHTWSFRGKNVTFQTKYFHFVFDTRTWNVFSVTARQGSEDGTSVHWSEEGTGTILDKLAEKMGWDK